MSQIDLDSLVTFGESVLQLPAPEFSSKASVGRKSNRTQRTWAFACLGMIGKGLSDLSIPRAVWRAHG